MTVTVVAERLRNRQASCVNADQRKPAGDRTQDELVIYSNCPNEATSAAAAKLLIAKGHSHVRSLQGGLDAWAAAGYSVQRLPLATHVPRGSAVQTAA